jgi:hypothetical protein
MTGSAPDEKGATIDVLKLAPSPKGAGELIVAVLA